MPSNSRKSPRVATLDLIDWLDGQSAKSGLQTTGGRVSNTKHGPSRTLRAFLSALDVKWKSHWPLVVPYLEYLSTLEPPKSASPHPLNARAWLEMTMLAGEYLFRLVSTSEATKIASSMFCGMNNPHSRVTALFCAHYFAFLKGIGAVEAHATYSAPDESTFEDNVPSVDPWAHHWILCELHLSWLNLRRLSAEPHHCNQFDASTVAAPGSSYLQSLRYAAGPEPHVWRIPEDAFALIHLALYVGHEIRRVCALHGVDLYRPSRNKDLAKEAQYLLSQRLKANPFRYIKQRELALELGIHRSTLSKNKGIMEQLKSANRVVLYERKQRRKGSRSTWNPKDTPANLDDEE